MINAVLIVGAGPVGLTMAIELTRFGVPVRIVDKAPQRTDKSKALVLWSRSLELLDRAGVSRPLIDAGCKVESVAITADKQSVATVTMAGLPTPYPFALMLPQSETERILEESLGTLGINVERGVELLNFSDDGETVRVKLRLANGTEQAAETAWLIGCDGAHSTMRHLLGKEFQGRSSLVDWLLADVHLEGISHTPEITVNWHPDGVLTMFPITGDRYRIVADIGSAHDSSARLPEPSLMDVQRVLDARFPGGAKASDPVWLSAFRINERRIIDYRGGRAFLAGDAAHVHSPMGGQGMNTGMQDACNLAWKLALVVKGSAQEGLLDSYTSERGPVAEAVIDVTSRITSLAIVKNKFVQSVRNHAASLILGLGPVRRFASTLAAELSIEYAHSPLNGDSNHLSPHSGQRAPIREGEPCVGSGSAPRFAVFSEGDGLPADLALRFGNLLEPALREPLAPGGLWVVRPDGYVAVSVKAGDWSSVSAYLEQLNKKGVDL